MSIPAQEDSLRQIDRATITLQREAAQGIELLEHQVQEIAVAKEALEQNAILLAQLKYQTQVLQSRTAKVQNSFPTVHKTVSVAAGAFTACCYGVATHLSNEILILYAGGGAALGWLASSLYTGGGTDE